ncbi:MAG: 16S rRNA (cytosine(1402)-N(4))-methyltransferase RsmH [Armatimonadota bacterium]|jgi:16S rRNA (cytosine1402-N4)-methyltransferase
MSEYHRPVLVKETLALLAPREGGVFVDATLGGGGHAEELLKKIGPTGTLIGIDRDPEALQYAGKRLLAMEGRLLLFEGNFADLASILQRSGVSKADGVIFDFGVSSHQLDSPRGFSFQRDEPLDMRMGRSELSAADIVNGYSEADLTRVIKDYGEERYARRIAKAIVRQRQEKQISTTRQLADLVVSAIPGGGRWQDIHPATRTFQGIRIEVNDELAAIRKAIPEAVDALKSGGVVAAISFHSLEDRLVKTIFRKLSGVCDCDRRLPACVCGARKRVEILTRKPVSATDEEIAENPRSRSAKLRAVRKLD